MQLYQNTKDENDLKQLCITRNSYRKLCRNKRNEYNFNLANDLVLLSKENPKLFWRKIKRKRKITNSFCDFHSHFKNLFESQVSEVSDEIKIKITEHATSGEINTDLFLDSEIRMVELEEALNKLNTNKSPGQDHIINEFLKYNTYLFRKAMLSVFNALLHNGYFPNTWAVGVIIPIFKNGDVQIADNYRGVTLLSCIGKLFTNILNTRLNKGAEADSKYDHFQYGFRGNKSTIDAMFILQSIVELFLRNKRTLYVSFIDLRKAFDCTNHMALWYKLHQIGINTKIITLIKDMYSKMKLCVKSSFLNHNNVCSCVDDTTMENPPCANCNHDVNHSHYFSPHSGVFQGESLSPFLFSMYLNDLNDYMKIDEDIGIRIQQLYMVILLFADDMVLFSESRIGLPIHKS